MNNQIIRATPTADNPDAIVFVPESTAKDISQGANLTGGGGAAGTTVAGPVVSFITQNGKVPLPITDTGQFSRQFSSSVDRTGGFILLETVGATPQNPYFVRFNQVILKPFTGSGEFYLDERDASDILGGESTVTVATKDGFSAGYFPGNIRTITVDKIYRIYFIPGTTGDGIYWINISALKTTDTRPVIHDYSPPEDGLPFSVVVPVSFASVIVELWGPGGGGGGSNSPDQAGGGGGSGAYVKHIYPIIPSDWGQSIYVSIPNGGLGGADLPSPGQPGQNNGDTTVDFADLHDDSIFLAGGGGNGGDITSLHQPVPGSGGIATGGATRIQGNISIRWDGGNPILGPYGRGGRGGIQGAPGDDGGPGHVRFTWMY